MATGRTQRPFRAFNFQLEIDDIARGAFSEVRRPHRRGRRGGLPRRHRPAAERAQAGRRCASTPTSRSSAATRRTNVLWDWYTNIVNGVADRRNVTIMLMNEAREPVLRWHAENAWINKIEGPELQSQRQRSGHRIGRAGARRADASRSEFRGIHRAITANPGRLLRAGRRERAGDCRAAHGHRRLRRHRRRAARCISRCRCSRGGSSRPISVILPAPAISPTPRGPSSKTAASAAGSCAWRRKPPRVPR